jgi:hypothetical protein
MTQLFSNNASGTLSVEIIIEAGPSSVTLQASEGDLFPIITAPDFSMCTVEDTGGNFEIMKITARTNGSDILTCERAQEGTAGQAFATGSRLELRTTAATFGEFIQQSGDQMQGELDMADNVLRDPLITDGEIRNAPIRGTDGGTANQILVPTAGAAPTLGGNTIIHTGNDTAYVQTTRTITGGEGIAALGDLSADRTVDLDLTELTATDGNSLRGDDLMLVYDDANTEHKKVLYREAGVPIINDTTINAEPTDDEVNAYWVCTNAATVFFDIDAGIGQTGNVFIVQQGGAGVIDFSGGTATIQSAVGDQTKEQYSVAILVCTQTNFWTLYGDCV